MEKKLIKSISIQYEPNENEFVHIATILMKDNKKEKVFIGNIEIFLENLERYQLERVNQFQGAFRF